MSHYASRSAMRQSLSYHRLASPRVANRIVAATGLAPPATVFEFGAGDGVLTRALAPVAGQLTAIEIDRDLHAALAASVAGFANVTPVHADFLDVALPRSGPYHVVANLPFSLTAEAMRHILRAPNPPRSAHLVVQREAAARWTGAGRSSLPGILAGLRFAFDVPLALRRRDFQPWPRVDSVLLAVCSRPAPLMAPQDEARFARFVRRGFGEGRRTLARNLASLGPKQAIHSALAATGIPRDAAPSALSFEQWLALWQEFDVR